ncbi:AraC-like DNA-binding protein [Kitasatospora sp. SolWspMP-SS2h]|uniref:helix-turn-helix domain-containing protein n=1 Tax=Kitasatospora sp. SolWspMP-SS2h TaxID=1305729 RepID=UPI000DBA63E7|nr:helix-turn-helix domain-containing protein [Kitasatospora sp. SolWspMP-SS2h]RAJ32008.1 AraC-like DNA-binding protein [Kitasatospora sp. SolWspMP-SS2h]
MTTTAGPGVPARDGEPGEYFERWRDLIARTRDAETSSPYADRFEAELRHLQLGPVTFLGTSFPHARFRRSATRVRRSDPTLMHLTLVLDGVLSLSLPDEPAREFHRGDLSLVTSSRPYDMRAFGVRPPGADRPRVDAVGIDFPSELLPVPPERLRSVLNRGFRARTGTAGLVPDFLLSLDRQAAHLGPAAAERLGPVVLDLVAAWLAEEIEATGELPPTARRRALVENVRAFVRRNLHDPALTPALIAGAHHVSVSYLHRVFTEENDGETVAAWIRRRRLERAHRDLADPALRGTPVHVLAVRCGIPRPDAFSRAFRAAYGLSPRDHRHRSLDGGQ